MTEQPPGALTVSIAMATYNGEKYLPQQLQSFLSQTRLPDELVVSDDCSSDATLKILEDFARNAPFAVNIRRNAQNLGYCGNFNAALMETTGDLVFLSDQDDVWLPEKIATVLALATQHPDTLAIMNDAALTDGALNEVGLTKLQQIRSAGYGEGMFVMGCCGAVRRELLDLCLPIPAGFKAHDQWLMNLADGLSAKRVTPRVLQYYRRHDSNESVFVSNRTTPVNRWHALGQQLQRVRASKSADNPDAAVQQLAMFAAGVERAVTRHRASDQPRLEAYAARVQAELARQQVRQAIRAKSPLARFIAVLTRYLGGKYRASSGLKSAIRDLLG